MARTPEEEARYQELLEMAGGNPMDALYADYGDTEEEDTGFFSNVVRGMGERATDLGGGLFGAAEDARAGLTEALGGDLRVGYNIRGEDSGFDVGFFTPEEIQKQGRVFDEIDTALMDVDLGYEERYTLQRMKDDPSISTIAGFGMETLGKSMVDMAGMYASLPLYFTARENEMADERAANDGRIDPTFGDYAAVAPGNAVATLMDKWSFGKLISTKGAKDLVEQAGKGALSKEIGKRILRESVTEGLIQEPAEYLSTHIDTEKGVQTDELGDVMLGGAVGGAFGGGVIGGPAAVIQRSAERQAAKDREEARVTQAKAEADAELAKADEMNAQAAAGQPIVEPTSETVIDDTPPFPTETVETTGPVPSVETTVEEEVLSPIPEAKDAVDQIVLPDSKVDAKTTAKRDTQDTVATVQSNKTRRKQARAERVLDNPKSTDEQIEQAESSLQEVQEETAIAQAKSVEQDIKRKEEDLLVEKEGFLSATPSPNQVKKNNAATTRLIADSLGIPTLKENGKNIPASTLKKQINEHPEVVAARTEQARLVEEGAIEPVKTEAQKKQDIADAKVSARAPEFTEAEVAQQATVEAAFTKVAEETTAEEAKVEAEESARVAKEEAEKVVIEAKAKEEQAKAEAAEAIKQAVAKESDRFTGWVEEDGTFFNEEGEIFNPPKKARAAYYKSVGKIDPEALTSDDKASPAFVRARQKYNTAVSQYENGTITKEELDAAEAKFNKVKTKLEKEGAEATEGETTTVKTEGTAAPEGMTVEGQQEVEVQPEGTPLEDIDSPFVDTDDVQMSAQEAVQELQERMDKAQEFKRCINA